ncbi:hypothetical protein JCM11251_007929 [Rhodosporidiobolus azoricus]
MSPHRPVRLPSTTSSTAFPSSAPLSPPSAAYDPPTAVLLSTGKRHGHEAEDNSDTPGSETSGGRSDGSSDSSDSDSAQEKHRHRRRRAHLRRRRGGGGVSGGDNSSTTAIIVILAFLFIVVIGVAVYYGMQKSTSTQTPSSYSSATGGTAGDGGAASTTSKPGGNFGSSTTSGSGGGTDSNEEDSGGASSKTASKNSAETDSRPTGTEESTDMSSGDSHATVTATDSAPEQTAVAPKSDDPFIQECLTSHNDFRAKHHVDPLTWNETLADAASRWIDVCEWKHSEGSLIPGGYGENLFGVAPVKEDAPPDAAGGIAGWNDEVKMYVFEPPMGFTHETGHFTQTVWKGTTQVGCAMRPCKGLFQSGEFGNYLVCEYYPPGNYADQFEENVLPE